jgi:fumarate hydratase class II
MFPMINIGEHPLQRSNKFFNIGKILVNISIIKSIAIIKRSAAIVHAKDKLITNKISKGNYQSFR